LLVAKTVRDRPVGSQEFGERAGGTVQDLVDEGVTFAFHRHGCGSKVRVHAGGLLPPRDLIDAEPLFDHTDQARSSARCRHQPASFGFAAFRRGQGARRRLL
jgi:hypothetical protein